MISEKILHSLLSVSVSLHEEGYTLDDITKKVHNLMLLGDQSWDAPTKLIPYKGSKVKYAKHILELIKKSKHTTYVEPFCGGLSLLLSKPPSKIEIVNDISSQLINLIRVIQSNPLEFIGHCRKMVNSRQEYWKAYPKDLTTLKKYDPILEAAKFFFRVYLSFGNQIYTGFAYGKTQKCTNYDQFLSSLGTIVALSDRLKDVTVLNYDYVKIFQKFNHPKALFVLDPPYQGCSGYTKDWDSIDQFSQDSFFMNVRTLHKWILFHPVTPQYQEYLGQFLYKKIPQVLRSPKGIQKGRQKAITLGVYTNVR